VYKYINANAFLANLAHLIFKIFWGSIDLPGSTCPLAMPFCICNHYLRIRTLMQCGWAANYCRTSDNVRLNLANVRAKVILIGHWSDHKKIVTLYIFLLWQNPIANLHFAIRHSSILLNIAPEWLYILVAWLIYILWRIYVRPNLVMLVFVRPNSSYVRPKLKVIGQMFCQVKYSFAALSTSYIALAFVNVHNRWW
jgi:hypothetical protein